MADRIYRRPDRRLALLEGPRALFEVGALIASAPYLSWSPRGDRHHVLVMPGFGASDRSTLVIRRFLDSLGYQALPWTLGTNLGPAMPELPERLAARLNEAYLANNEEPVSIVGWSLGGVYARMLAQLSPNRVRQVLTLGSPFGGSPMSTALAPIVQSLQATNANPDRIRRLRMLAGEALTVPSTAIYSRTDAIVPWRIATQTPSDIAENIEVFTSHTGLGVSPAVLYALADRLAQPEDEWQPFKRIAWKRAVYGPALLSDERAAKRPRDQETKRPRGG